MLHPHTAPKNGCKNVHADSSISFRPVRASHRSAPHVFVTVLSDILIKDISLLGCSKVPEGGQRSQVHGVSEETLSASRNNDLTDGEDEGFPVGLFVGFVVGAEDGPDE